MNQAYPALFPLSRRERGGVRGGVTGQKGNAIWFILLAIALLAALTLAISHFSDTAEQTGNIELDNIQASQILRITKGWDQAVNQMQTHEISANDISFASAGGMAGYANPNCAADNCRFFQTGGGAQTYAAPDTAWLDSINSAAAFYGQWIFTGKLCVQGVGDISEAVGTNCNTDPAASELAVLLPYVKEGLCIQLNNLLGIPNPGGKPPADTGDIWAASPQFTGTYATGTNIGVGDANLYRKPSGCIEGSGSAATPPSGTFTFYHVLLAR